MRRLRFSSHALDNLTGIGRYLLRASGSSRVADGFVEALIDRCEKLASLPGVLGRDRSELRPGLRSLAFRGYVIFFHYLDDEMHVLATLEGHRDIIAYFGDEDV